MVSSFDFFLVLLNSSPLLPYFKMGEGVGG